MADKPPIVRSRFAASWLRLCDWIYNVGAPNSSIGPSIVNALHRVRLYPIALPPDN
jgi:hypothetical protein